GLPAAGLPKAPGAATGPSVPSAAGTGVRGVVWLDFARGGGGRPGAVDSNERGLPGMTVEAVRDGRVVSRTRTDSAGHFAFPALTGDGYTVRLPDGNFRAPFNGLTWLGPTLVTPAVIGSYPWAVAR